MSTISHNNNQPMTRYTTLLWLAVISTAAFAIRYSMLDNSNPDIVNYSLPWLAQLRDLGLWKAISGPFSELGYPPFYTYAMGLANWLLPSGTDGKSVMKAIPIFFDFVAAGLVFKIATLRWGADWRRIAAYTSILFAPTILLNGAYWGQSDIVFSSFIVGCMLCLLRRSDLWAMVFFGLALSVKLQTMWFGPFILMMLMRGRIRWPLVAFPPIIYFIFAIPTLFAGRSALEVLTIYFTQVESQTRLNYSAPNIQFLIGYIFNKQGWGSELVLLFARISILSTACMSLYYAWRFSRKDLTDETMLIAAVISVLMVPQFLPHMHERYFFSADVLTIVLAVWRPAYWPAALLMQFTSFVSYIAFLWGGALLARDVPAVIRSFGFTNNLQWVTGLVAIAGILNLLLLIWFWRRLRQLQLQPLVAD